MLTCDHPVSLDRYNDRVEDHLQVTRFYHASQIGIVQNQKALVNALIERWHPDTHMFHLPIGECAVTLEDVALILGLQMDGLPVTGMTMSSFSALEAECLHQFGVALRKSECRGCCIKLTWLRDLKENIQLTDELSIQRYVKCHIMLLIGTILFGDKSGAGVHWKFLPLLRDFASIGHYSWGSACLAHLYRRWRNWERGDRRYRYLNLAHFRKAFDELQEGQGVPQQEQNLDKAHGEVLTGPKNLNWATTPSHSSWVMHWTNRYHYVLSKLPMPSQHPLETYMYWYRSKYRDHLNLSNVVGQKSDEDNQDMDEGNQDMDDGGEGMDEDSQDADNDNEELEPQSVPPPTSNPLPQEQPQFSSQYVTQTQFSPSFPMPQQYWGMSQFEPGEGGSFSQLLEFMAADAGQPQYANQPEFLAGRYSLDARLPCHTSSVASGGFVFVDSSRSVGGRGVFNSQNPNRIDMGPLQEDANPLEQETNAYLVDDPDDEDDDDEDEIEEFDEDEESRNDGRAQTPDDKDKGYNMRIDPSRRSANRYTPSVLKKAAKNARTS
ncbi:hypothetical protein Ahy_B06g083322 [Arachis hypogaea]|uniref:Aminotransferase-like plant mobile domain-containing protein n=1 Tax=Arachis hypogaea TaxID=3818 RepID=A0A444YPM6_ARAHY|nr:hypothetical protein Ahy_B06g083322 [Arachis hypogaea]